LLLRSHEATAGHLPANPRQGRVPFLDPRAPARRGVSKGLRIRQRGLAPLIYPCPVDPLLFLAEIEDRNIEHVVREGALLAFVPLDNELRLFEKPEAAELEEALLGAVDRDRAEYQKRRGSGPVLLGRPSVILHLPQQRGVAARLAERNRRGGLVISEVANVAMVQIEYVVPWRSDASGLPGTRTYQDRRTALPILGGDAGDRVDARVEGNESIAPVCDDEDVAIVTEQELVLVLRGIAKDLVHSQRSLHWRLQLGGFHSMSIALPEMCGAETCATGTHEGVRDAPRGPCTACRAAAAL
jgi:hypothetical protein